MKPEPKGTGVTSLYETGGNPKEEESSIESLRIVCTHRPPTSSPPTLLYEPRGSAHLGCSVRCLSCCRSASNR
ncbi:Protein of unknown function [Gryllus bimaculatus]|nr:Protein of unknown function [Gryllus bimaculatus]